ncbi:FAD-dependent monooxygenase DEP4 [Zalerion maritima]|uniref:FAD-dependent monooxygenase DEP4 n=1 Tax=Zalerion maritima TaxID=339359 RepID=A0AAD5RVA1_9PEZI|nr:FAD-dependent monooxygenase DEP4 [Zalerion maritima]
MGRPDGDPTPVRRCDLVVVGAGFFGLGAARNFHALYPDESLLVLEAQDGVGGTWARERLHPDLKSNNLWGSYEYPDFSMRTRDGKAVEGGTGRVVVDGEDKRRYDVGEEEHIPAAVMNGYLEDYARDGGVFGRVRFGTKVVAARHLEGEEYEEGGWVLSVVRKVTDADAGADGEEWSKETTVIKTRKLVVATGLTNQSFLPEFEGQGVFMEGGSTIYHAKDFWKVNRGNKEFRDEEWESKVGNLGMGMGGGIERNKEKVVKYSRKKVTVLGGTKTGWDLVYAYATRGFEVEWVIRESGYGPTWMAPIRVTPFGIRLEHIVQSRLVTWMSPCIWGSVDGYSLPRWLLQCNPIGRAIVRAFWWVLGNDALTLSKLQEHPETKKLIPWSNAMFVGTGFSILNYDKDILEYVRNGQVRVHIADIERLSRGKVHLSGGKELDADALACATGWKHAPPIKFLPEGIERDIGIPHAMGSTEEEEGMNRLAEKIVLEKYPILKDPPTVNRKYRPLPGTEGLEFIGKEKDPNAEGGVKPAVKTTLTPYRLFRFMVPPSPKFLETRDLAFVGMLMNFSVATMAHLQGIWVSRFLMGEHPLFPTIDSNTTSEGADEGGEVSKERWQKQVMWETILHTANCRLRCPVPNGERHPDFVFDALPYVDMLCQDLGLRKHRKGWAREWFRVHLCQDYGHALEELGVD